MAVAYIVPSSSLFQKPTRTIMTCGNSSSDKSISYIPPLSSTPLREPLTIKPQLNSANRNSGPDERNYREEAIPTMFEIMDSSKAQKLDLQLQTLGPFFRITASSLDDKIELGRAEGLIRVWLDGRILHLDSIRLIRETLKMEKSIFGIGLFMGAVAVRHGYDCGCRKAELLAINDTDLYHSKLVRFYTRIGFKVVREVTGSSMRDLADMLVWGGKGTRMDANVVDLLIKWGVRFKARR